MPFIQRLYTAILLPQGVPFTLLLLNCMEAITEKVISLWLEKGISDLKRSCVTMGMICSCIATEHRKEDSHASSVQVSKKNQIWWGKQSRERMGYQVQAHMAVGAFTPRKCQGAAVASGGSSAQDRRFRCQMMMTMGFFIFFAILPIPNIWIIMDVIDLHRGTLWCLNTVNQTIG